MLIAQITDLHIGFDRDNPHELNVRRLNMVIDQLNELQPRPDLLLVTGDLVENGDDVGAYSHMIALVGRWQGPTLWAIGNHDDRAHFRTALPKVPVDANGFIQYEHDFGGLRWVVIDTLDAGRHGGAFCELRAAWLPNDWQRGRGSDSDCPPSSSGRYRNRLDERRAAGGYGSSGLRGDRAGWPGRGDACRAVHRPAATSFAGKPLIIAPSTAPLVALDLDHVDPLHPDGRALIIADAPAYALHRWDDGRLLTHFEIAGPRNVLAAYDSNLQPMMKAFLEERGTG